MATLIVKKRGISLFGEVDPVSKRLKQFTIRAPKSFHNNETVYATFAEAEKQFNKIQKLLEK